MKFSVGQRVDTLSSTNYGPGEIVQVAGNRRSMSYKVRLDTPASGVGGREISELWFMDTELEPEEAEFSVGARVKTKLPYETDINNKTGTILERKSDGWNVRLDVAVPVFGPDDYESDYWFRESELQILGSEKPVSNSGNQNSVSWSDLPGTKIGSVKYVSK